MVITNDIISGALIVRVGKNIRSQRSACGMTLEDLAHDAAVSVSHLGGIERGRQNTTIDVLERIATALGVDPLALLAQDPIKSRDSGLPAMYNDFYDRLPATIQRHMRAMLDAYIKSLREAFDLEK